jgi:hypothetical protein
MCPKSVGDSTEWGSSGSRERACGRGGFEGTVENLWKSLRLHIFAEIPKKEEVVGDTGRIAS